MRTSISFVFLFAPFFALAQAPPGGGGTDPANATVAHGYVRLSAQIISNYPENGYISGTNIGFNTNTHGYSTILPDDPSMMQPSDIVGWRLDGYTVSVNGQTVRTYDRATHPAPQPGQPLPPAPGSCGVRFASTHFAHGSSIELKVVATYALQTWADRGTSVYSGAHQVTATRTVQVYNRGLALHTDEYVPTTGGYALKPSPGAYDFDDISPSASTAAESDFPTMKHPIIGGDNGNGHHLKAGLLTRLGQMTAFFACTHGEEKNFRPTRPTPNSAGTGIVAGSEKLTFENGPGSEVAVAVATRAGKPMPNIVVMHACDTLRGTTVTPFGTRYHAAEAFGLMDGPNNLANRAYAGFDEVVYSRTLPPTGATFNGTLAQHAALVYAGLRDGMSLKDAIDSAQSNYVPCNSAGQRLSLKIKGDETSRLIKVYTAGHASPDWYIATGY